MEENIQDFPSPPHYPFPWQGLFRQLRMGRVGCRIGWNQAGTRACKGVSVGEGHLQRALGTSPKQLVSWDEDAT